MSDHDRSLGAIWEAAERRRRILSRHPHLQALEEELARAIMASPLSGGKAVEAARAAKAAYLQTHRIPDNYAEPQWRCPLCQDEGFTGGKACNCRRQAEIERRFSGARLPALLRAQTFAGFDLKWYSAERKTPGGVSERQRAEMALNACRNFVAGVLESGSPRGLYISGGVGLGKTFLLSAICNSLVEGGVPTLYTVFSDLIADIKRSFEPGERQQSEGALMGAARSTEILILDDLGAEQITDFVQSRLFDIVNYRRNHGLPMVISSNLSIEELGSLYGQRIMSRIHEACTPVKLYGSDIRLQKERRH